MQKPFLKFSILLALAAISHLAHATQFEIFPETPFFAAPDAASQILWVSSSDNLLESDRSVPFQLLKNPAVTHHHPVVLLSSFHRVKTPDGKDAWFSEDLRFDTRTSMLLPIACPNVAMSIPLTVALVALVLCVLFALRSPARAFAPSWTGLLFALAFLLSLRCSLMLFCLFNYGALAGIPIDERDYFQIAECLLAGDFNPERKWIYTIGNPLLYLPFILLFNAKSYFDIMQGISLFNCLLISPLSLFLVWLVVKKLSGSVKKAFIAAALWALLPFFVYPIEIHPLQVFKNAFGLPEFNAGSYKLFFLDMVTGWNGQSDTPSTFLVLLCLCPPLLFKPRAWTFCAASALFGAACLMRINNILFAPLLAYLFWHALAKENASLTRILKMALLSFACFLAAQAPQLTINAIQLGSPFMTPYILHPDGAWRGFVPSFIPMGSNLLLGANFLYVALGAASLAFIRDRFLRTTICLWTLPIVIFFCGYPVVGSCSTRFILTTYPGFLAALVCASFWNEMKKSRAAALILTLFFTCVLVSPCNRFVPPFALNIDNFPWGEQANLALNILMPPFCLSVAAWLFFGKEKAAALFLLLFSVLFFLGSPRLIFVVLVLECLLALASAAIEIARAAGLKPRASCFLEGGRKAWQRQG